MATMLRVGDNVKWRGGFGRDAEREATVTGITICKPESKYGESVSAVPWFALSDRGVIVDLRTRSAVSHWAYGFQLQPTIQDLVSAG